MKENFKEAESSLFCNNQLYGEEGVNDEIRGRCHRTVKQWRGVAHTRCNSKAKQIYSSIVLRAMKKRNN